MKYIVLSDIHFGHKRTPTWQIIRHLNHFFKEHIETIKTLDYIFIAGDVFDSLLSPNSDDYKLGMGWLSKLLTFCRNKKISLRILEGTPSHDRRQVSALSSIIKELKLEDLDYKYIDDLCILKEKDYHILYVPDEYRDDARETLDIVKERLSALGLQKVDIAMMHGCFPHQMPIQAPFIHDAESYLELVTYYIHIGHIHTSSVYQRILAQGSFDRLAHGEEEKKGAMVAEILGSKSMYSFLENTKATLYRTIELKQADETAVFKILDSIPVDDEVVHIRFLLEEDSTLTLKPSVLKTRYPMIQVKLQKGKKRNPIEEVLPKFTQLIDLEDDVSITQSKLKKTLYDAISNNIEPWTKAQTDIYNEEYDKIERMINGH